MSAWIVDKEHIDLLVSAGLRGVRRDEVSPNTTWHKLDWFAVPYGDVRAFGEGRSYEDLRRALTFETADAVGQMLWTENVASVAARYPDDSPASRPGPVSEDIDEEAIGYTFSDPRYTPTAGEILQAIGCYEYQSCEHDGWNTSEARQFCDALRHAVIGTLYEGPWGWDADALKTARLTTSAAAL